jgi:hypothetical protein
MTGIGDKEMKKIKEAVVLYSGWEMDNEAWVEQDSNGKNYLFTTTHCKKIEMTIESLDLKIEETKESLIQLNALRELVT